MLIENHERVTRFTKISKLNKMPVQKLSLVKIEKRKEMDRYRVGLNVAMSEFIY